MKSTKKTDKKTILITGGAGFVGHHCVEHILKNRNWKIIVLDALNYAGNLNRITDITIFSPERVKFIWHDLRSPIHDLIHSSIGNLDFVIHFASESHVDRSLENALPFAMSNVVGTTNLLEYIKNRQPNLKKYIGFNTDEVFGAAPEKVYHTEEYKFKPSNPYAAAKGGQWCMEYAFAHAFNIPIIMVHSMNIIGERQHPEKFIPKTIKAFLKKEKIVLHGIGPKDQSSRCWIHARNVADGLLFLLENGQTGETYNITGQEKSVFEIANWICQVTRREQLRQDEVRWLDYHCARPGHDKRYALDGTKLKNLGWAPPVGLEESIRKTVVWTLKKKNRKWLNL